MPRARHLDTHGRIWQSNRPLRPEARQRAGPSVKSARKLQNPSQPLPGTVSDIAAVVIRDAAYGDHSNAMGFGEVVNLMLDTVHIVSGHGER